MWKTTLIAVALTCALTACDDPADEVPTATVEEPTEEPEEPGEAADGDEAEADSDGAPQPPGALVIDTSASTFEFVGSKVTGSETGHFGQWSGWIELREPFEQTAVSIEIQMATVTTERDRLTQHLRSDDFFDVPNHPTARFVTSRFAPAPEGSGDATHLVTGALTLRGQTQTITFPATIAVTDEAVTARAEFSIDRNRWGVSYRGMEDDLIRDQVVIRFDVRASRDSG